MAVKPKGIRLVEWRGHQVKTWDYPDVPDELHKWCPGCHRAMVNMEYGDRSCPLCGYRIVKGG